MTTEQPKAPAIKAYSYLRFSTPEQMKGDSFRRQTKLAKDYAQKLGLTLDDHSFHDLGISAYQGKNRQTGALGIFLRAVEDEIIAEGSYLLVESLDRISRQSAHRAASVLSSICEMGINVVTLFDGRVYSAETLEQDPMTFMMAVLTFQRANEESATKAKRLRSVWESKRKMIAEGKPVRLTSRAPQWLKPSDDGVGFDIIPERGEVVRNIFKWTLEGTGKQSIAARLNREGAPIFGRGKLWHTSYVSKILTNTATYGTLTPFTSRADRKEHREACEPIEGYYPAVIDRETFEAVQALKASASPRRGRHSSSPVQNIVGGLAVCPLCDSRMIRVTKNKAKGWVYLVCHRAKQGAGCVYNAVRVDMVEPFIQENISYIAAQCPVGDDDFDERFDDLIGQLEGVEGLIHNIVTSIENGLDPSKHPAIGERLTVLQEQQEALKEEIDQMGQQRISFNNDVAQRRAQKLVAAVQENWEDKEQINTLMRGCFSKVVVDFTTGLLEFHWQQGGEETLITYTFLEEEWVDPREASQEPHESHLA
ncbi:recombinase family protein [bacterium Scap17]|nr:recombinase family protein [bacterium Scap17]